MPEDVWDPVTITGDRPRGYLSYAPPPNSFPDPPTDATPVGGIGLPTGTPFLDNLAEPIDVLPEVVITAERRPRSLWQRIKDFFRRDPPMSDAEKKKLYEFWLYNYGTNFVPMPVAGRAPIVRRGLPAQLRGGPRSLRRQRGFVSPGQPNPNGRPVWTPPARPQSPPTRTAPTTDPARPLRVAPVPVLRPALPPGYEEDPDWHPDLVAAPAPVPQPEPQRAPLRQPAPTVTPGPSTMPVPAPLGVPLPSRVPAPSPQPSPIPVPVPRPSPVPTPSPVPQIRPLPTPQPRTPSQFASPVATPAPVPTPVGSPRPVPTPAAMPRLSPVPAPMFQPQPAPSFQPPGRADPDACVCEKGKKKKAKKKKPRTICYSGSFRETRYSTSKRRRKEIPCQ